MHTLYCIGNPTLKHKLNRHSVGLMLGHYLIEKLELKTKKFKNFQLSNKFSIDGEYFQIAISDNQNIEFCSHEAAERVLRCADDRLAAHVETRVHQHGATGLALERLKQGVKLGICPTINSLYPS